MTEPQAQTSSRPLPRWLKITAAALLGSVLVVAALVVSLPGIVSSEFARTTLVAKLQQATGKSASLGALSFSWGKGLEVRSLRIGDGGPEDQTFLCSMDILKLDFGFDSVFGRKVWVDASLAGLSYRHEATATAEPQPSTALAPAQALKQSLESLRQALRPVPISGDLRLRANLDSITVAALTGGKTLRIHIPQASMEAPSLRHDPLRLALSANSWVNAEALPPLSLQAEVSELVDAQHLLRPGSAKLSANVKTEGLTLDISGGLDTGLKTRLNLDAAAIQSSFRPMLPAENPSVRGRIELTTLMSLKGQDNLSANVVLTVGALSLTGGQLGAKSIGPVDLSLMQEAAADLAAGTLEMPGALSIQSKSKASWVLRATGLAESKPELSAQVDTLHLDLGDLLVPVRAMLPPGLAIAKAQLDSGPILASIRPSATPGGNPGLKAEAQGITFSANGIQAGPKSARISVSGVEVKAETLTLDLPEAGHGTAKMNLAAVIDMAKLSATKSVTVRKAELKRLSVDGSEIGLTQQALFDLAGRFNIDMESQASDIKAAGLLSAPSVSKSQRLIVDCLPEKRVVVGLEHSRVDMPGLKLLRPGKKDLELPLHIEANANALTIARDSAGGLVPSVSGARMKAEIGQALHMQTDSSFSADRVVTSNGSLVIDADKLTSLLGALLPQRPKGSGALNVAWNVDAALPKALPGADKSAPLSVKLKELGFLRRAEATLNMKALSLDLPLAAKPGQKPETLRLRGLSTPRPLALSTTQGLAESTLTGTLAFGPMDEAPGIGKLRKPVSGLFTINGAQQGLRSVQFSQMLTLDGFKLNENLSLTLDKLDALLDSSDRFATALERADATASFTLSTGLDALPQVSDKGISGRGGIELGADARLSGGRSLTMAMRMRSPGMDLRLGPDISLLGLTSDIALRRRYTLRPGLSCAGATPQEIQQPLSEQVFDIAQGVTSPYSPSSDFALRTLYDIQARRSGALAFAALDLRSGPLPIAMRDFGLVLDTSGPLPAIQSFRLGLFGGNVLGRAALKGGSGRYSLDAACSFTGIDTAKILPGKSDKDTGDLAELSGRVSLSLPLTPDPVTLLTRMDLSADITKVGPRTLERALYALDPDETNETIVQQRRLMGIGYPRNLNMRIAYGNLSLSGQVEVKGFRLDIPPIDRLSLANLPIRDQLGPALKPIPALLDTLDLLSASSICRDPAKSAKAGGFGVLNLSRTAQAQGATP